LKISRHHFFIFPKFDGGSFAKSPFFLKDAFASFHKIKKNTWGNFQQKKFFVGLQSAN
jgi:hypothetical protein